MSEPKCDRCNHVRPWHFDGPREVNCGHIDDDGTHCSCEGFVWDVPCIAPYNIGADVWPGLSKLIEEAGEVQQVAGKLIGTGGDSKHWDGSDLRERLQEEIADVIAACSFVVSENHLDADKIGHRTSEKIATFRKWHQGTK